jgi:hypothetical protein
MKLLVKQLATPLGNQKTVAKWLVMLRCVKNFLLTYKTYAALRNFFRALHLGELWNFRGSLNSALCKNVFK